MTRDTTPPRPGTGLFARTASGKPPLFDPAALIALAGVDESTLPLPALESLCSAFEHAPMRLTFRGRKYAESTVIDALVKRHRLASFLERYPEIEERAIERPIFIVAPFRSSTTHLHRLLAADARHRAPRFWEALLPPPTEPLLRGDPRYLVEDSRIPTITRHVEGVRRRRPQLAQLHPIDPNGPEECFGLLESSLLSPSFALHGAVVDYLAWLTDRPHRENVAALRTYRSQLQLLDWWWPGSRWVLKSPVLMWSVRALLDVFPDATIVQIHRRPHDSVRSMSVLLREMYRAISHHVDDRVVGAVVETLQCVGAERCATQRRNLPADRFFDVSFERATRAPLDVLREIHALVGSEPTDEPDAVLRGDREQRSRGMGQAPPAQLEEFGLDATAIQSRFAAFSALSPTAAGGAK